VIGLACNAPTPTPQALPTPPSQEAASPQPTEAEPGTEQTPTPQTTTDATPTATDTPLSPTPTDTPTPTPTKEETETPTPPISTGPLDFIRPAGLDHWEALPDDKYECRIVLRITGGAPPYTVHHDLEVFETWETRPTLVFTASGCGSIVHTIKVESADGQTALHDYFISAPWCAE